MFCKYCGKKIDDDSTFCAGCGLKISAAMGVAAEDKPKTEVKKAKLQRDYTEGMENIDLSPVGILAQFSMGGRVVFIILCLLIMIWVAALTLHTFYPEYISFLSNL